MSAAASGGALTAALAAARPFDAPAGWAAIDFISDLHLSPAMPRTFAAWADHLRPTTADAVFILGDLFDAWIGDDSRDDPFEARCWAVLADAARRRTLAFMAGNRDFLVGEPLLADCGVLPLADPTLLAAFGQRVLLTHGDALCLADTAYQRFRAQVRDARWQAAALARPLAERRLLARALRDGSDAHQQAAALPVGATDVDPAETLRMMRNAGAGVVVHGHTHRPQSAPLAPGAMRHVLSDWDLDADPAQPRAEVLRLTRDGFERIAPAALPAVAGGLPARGGPHGPAR